MLFRSRKLPLRGPMVANGTTNYSSGRHYFSVSHRSFILWPVLYRAQRLDADRWDVLSFRGNLSYGWNVAITHRLCFALSSRYPRTLSEALNFMVFGIVFMLIGLIAHGIQKRKERNERQF